MRWFFLAFLVALTASVAVLGFRGSKTTHRPIEIFDDMDHQPKVKAQASMDFFADGRGDRPEVPGTVPFNAPVEDPYYMTGVIDGNYGDGIPVPVDEKLLERGRDRFAINCLPCHGAVGNGQGVVSKYGFGAIASYHQDRLRDAPDGQIFYTIGHGSPSGLMYPMTHVSIADRWAIVAYVRALQLSQHAPLEDVPPAEREKLK